MNALAKTETPAARVYIDAQRVRAAIAAVLAENPELADDEQLRADTLEGAVDLHEVAARLVREAKETAALADSLAYVIASYTDRRRRLEGRVEGYRALLLKLLLAADLPRLEIAEATVSTRRVPPKLVVDDEAAIPADCRKTKTVESIDRDAIKTALEAGFKVPGARMTNGDVGLTIR